MQPFQNDAAIAWEAADTSGKWMIKLTKRGDTASTQAISQTHNIKVNGLDPDSQYNIRIRYMKDSVTGKAVSSKFRTYPVTSSFPYIFIDKEGYRKGEAAQLRVFNLSEKHKRVNWHANGEIIEGNTFVPQEEGDVILEAAIYYYDGSEERIYKRISVE